jgi:cysteine desulfurase
MWFAKKNKRTYLDYAAGVAANPSSPHEEGRIAKRVLEDARTAIARLIEVQPDDVIFTSGATEANALAILGHVRALRAQGHKKLHVLGLPTAHASIIENLAILAHEGVKIEPLPIKDYRVDTGALAKLLIKETALVTMDAVCGETGTVWNTREVADTIRKARSTAGASKILLHVDASQASLTEKIMRAHFDADLVTFDGSKVGNVRGIGALIAARTIPIAALYGGGGQERGVRPGSESPELAQRFAASLAVAVNERAAFRARAERERAALLRILTTAIKRLYVQEGSTQAPHILNLSFPGRDTDYLVALMDESGFAVSTRSACETDSEEGSRAVLALTGDEKRAKSTLRISWGREVSTGDLVRFSAALVENIRFLDSTASG